jgi:mRNA interferase MazF
VNRPIRGEVWMVDLGMAAKVRPCLVLSVPVEESDRSLVIMRQNKPATRKSATLAG